MSTWIIIIVAIVLVASGISLLLWARKRENYCDSLGPVPTYNFDDGYRGLANPAGILQYNTVYLQAQEAGCGDCVDASQICMENPFGEECQEAVSHCQDNCKDPGVLKNIQKAQELVSNKQWSPNGRCWYSSRGIGPDPSIPDPNFFL
jgi:nitrogen fixation-related uncharacterized protein